MSCTDEFRTGYTFNTYRAPAGQWGEVLTADDMRETFLFGNDLIGTNGREATNEQLKKFVDLSVAEFETALDLVIRKRIYRTNYKGSERRSPRFERDGIDKWTHIEDAYPFIRRNWEIQGYVLLNHRPVISVERAILKTVTGETLLDLSGNGWVRLDRNSGQVHLYPTRSTSYPLYGPYLGAWGTVLNSMTGDYFDGFEFDYTAGYESSDFVPDDLRQVIGELAAIGILNWVGDGLLAGFSSSSVSLDGLSESFSSTQSATSAYYGARIMEYRGHIKQWLERNRYKYSNVTIISA